LFMGVGLKNVFWRLQDTRQQLLHGQ